MLPTISNEGVLSLTGAQMSGYANSYTLLDGQYAFCNTTSDGYIKDKLYVYGNHGWTLVSEPYKFSDIEGLFPQIINIGV